MQWDTSEHDWLEGRGEKLYLIHMIDDATSTLTARFVRWDSTEENLRVLWRYLEQHGRPATFYTDKASQFQTTPKIPRDAKQLPRDERDPLPPTQIGRALRELGIVWIAAHSPQAKGRVERSFGTAQDRLVKGLRVAQARTLEQANCYLEEEFLPWWNQALAVEPANAADARRPLGAEQDLAASLSRVESRQVDNDYTIAVDGSKYRILSRSMPAGLRRAIIRLERRLDGTLAVRFRERYFALAKCGQTDQPIPPTAPAKAAPARRPRKPMQASRAALDAIFNKPGMPVWQAANVRPRRPEAHD